MFPIFGILIPSAFIVGTHYVNFKEDSTLIDENYTQYKSIVVDEASDTEDQFNYTEGDAQVVQDIKQRQQEKEHLRLLVNQASRVSRMSEGPSEAPSHGQSPAETNKRPSNADSIKNTDSSKFVGKRISDMSGASFGLLSRGTSDS